MSVITLYESVQQGSARNVTSTSQQTLGFVGEVPEPGAYKDDIDSDEVI